MILKLLVLFCLFISLEAHQTGLSYINIVESADAEIAVVYKKPLSDTRGEDISVQYPQKCSEVSHAPTEIENGFIINKYRLWCQKEGLQNERVWVEGLVSSDRGVLIRYEKGSFIIKSLLRATTPFIYIDKKSSSFDLFVEYLQLGVFHIWSGYDHLLFVLSLLLLANNFKKVLYAISAFTLSHSITLACGILGIISVGVPFIESMIALSIVFLARELLRDTPSFTKNHLGVVAFIFGLLHGFGFSTALKDIGLPQDEIPLSLFSFNVGIELGQIVFIVVVSTLLYVFKKYILKQEYNFKPILGLFIGVTASFWFIQRVMSF